MPNLINSYEEVKSIELETHASNTFNLELALD
jgi:hypothetical protein